MNNGWRTVLALVAVFFVFGAGEPPARSGPAARFETRVHDFGVIAGDTKAVYEWPIYNDGTEPLEIVNTFPTCGCTASLIETKAIPPGGKGILRVTFDSTGQLGDVRKTIAVVTTDPTSSRTILTIKAKVLAPVSPRLSEGHPPITGQSMLAGTCGSCHAQPAAGKSGEELYAAVCAMCHGPEARGALAYGLRDPSYLGGRDDTMLAEAIAYGTANPRMPGFADAMGGPLDSSQVDSLVQLLRRWGPIGTPADATPAPGSSAGRGGAGDR